MGVRVRYFNFNILRMDSHNKLKFILIQVAISTLLVGLVAWAISARQKDVEPETGVTQQDNVLYGMSPNSTTTAAVLPVLVLARDRFRNYAAVINDSDTAVYITCKNFDSPSAASTTADLDGIRLNASGGSLEFLPENLCLSDVWASSTVSGKKILFVSSTLAN